MPVSVRVCEREREREIKIQRERDHSSNKSLPASCALPLPFHLAYRPPYGYFTSVAVTVLFLSKLRDELGVRHDVCRLQWLRVTTGRQQRAFSSTEASASMQVHTTKRGD
ncbi:hypothetical protein ILYODFUR_022453 [Ilyodon furcidens]|uniref:Uncharacterized protein n=1 Tax=Ilyodon furcidens TaxID=33524 RepID=A0ABV0TNA0_9TELE